METGLETGMDGSARAARRAGPAVRVIRDVSEAEWWARVRGLGGEATFFQTPLWATVLAAAFPDLRSDTRIYELADGAQVLVPLMRRRRFGGSVATLESMPLGTYGAFLSERALVRAEALAILSNLRRSWPPVARLVMTPNPLGRFPIPGGVFPRQDSVHVLPLGEGYDQIWEHRFTGENRTAVRKSIRRGVKVGIERGEAAFLEFYRLYRSAAERWERMPPYDERFFAALARVDERHVQLRVARLEGMFIAGGITFAYGDQQASYMASFNREFRAYRPNNLILAEAIKWGVSKGHKIFNLGSSAGIKGVESFKSSFGSERIFFDYYLYENPLVRLRRPKPQVSRRA